MNNTPQAYEDFLVALDQGEVIMMEATDEARARVRRMILEATNATSLKQAHEVVRSGRPRVGEEREGPSKKLQVRITDEMKDDLISRAHEEGRNRSDLVRDALSLYLYETSSRSRFVGA